MSTDHRDNASTILEKLGPQLVTDLEHAIIHRTPPTFTACFQKFNLADHGLSFSAFYRFARRLRDQARLAKLAEWNADDAGTAMKAIPHLVAQQLVDCLMAENPSPRAVIRLTSAYRQAAQVHLAREKFDLVRQDRALERKHTIEVMQDLINIHNERQAANTESSCATDPPTGQRESRSERSIEIEPRAPVSGPSSSAQSASSADSTPQVSGLRSQAFFDSLGDRVSAAIDARLPPSLRPDPRHDPSNGRKKKHRAAAPS